MLWDLNLHEKSGSCGCLSTPTVTMVPELTTTVMTIVRTGEWQDASGMPVPNGIIACVLSVVYHTDQLPNDRCPIQYLSKSGHRGTHLRLGPPLNTSV